MEPLSFATLSAYIPNVRNIKDIRLLRKEVGYVLLVFVNSMNSEFEKLREIIEYKKI